MIRMKCSVIRDVMPLYVEGDCSLGTNRVVEKHIKSCAACRELYEQMKSPIDIKGIAPSHQEEAPDLSTDFWRKYYGRLICRGIGLFFAVYIVVVSMITWLK